MKEQLHNTTWSGPVRLLASEALLWYNTTQSTQLSAARHDASKPSLNSIVDGNEDEISHEAISMDMGEAVGGGRIRVCELSRTSALV